MLHVANGGHGWRSSWCLFWPRWRDEEKEVNRFGQGKQQSTGDCWCRRWMLESPARGESGLVEGGGGRIKGRVKREKKGVRREKRKCKMNYKIIFLNFLSFYKNVQKFNPVSCK